MKNKTFANYQIWVGNNARENWELLDQAAPEDYWFHLVNYPSAHVILAIPTPNEGVPIEVMKYCAEVCQQHSKYPQDQVMYTERKHVKKTKILGQVKANKVRYLTK